MNKAMKDKLKSKPRSISLVNISTKPDLFIQQGELKRRKSLSPIQNQVGMHFLTPSNSELEKIDEMGFEENQSSIQLTQQRMSSNSFLRNSKAEEENKARMIEVEELKRRNNEYQQLYQNSLYNSFHLEEKINSLCKEIQHNQEVIMKKDARI